MIGEKMVSRAQSENEVTLIHGTPNKQPQDQPACSPKTVETQLEGGIVDDRGSYSFGLRDSNRLSQEDPSYYNGSMIQDQPPMEDNSPQQMQFHQYQGPPKIQKVYHETPYQQTPNFQQQYNNIHQPYFQSPVYHQQPPVVETPKYDAYARSSKPVQPPYQHYPVAQSTTDSNHKAAPMLDLRQVQPNTQNTRLIHIQETKAVTPPAINFDLTQTSNAVPKKTQSSKTVTANSSKQSTQQTASNAAEVPAISSIIAPKKEFKVVDDEKYTKVKGKNRMRMGQVGNAPGQNKLGAFFKK